MASKLNRPRPHELFCICAVEIHTNRSSYNTKSKLMSRIREKFQVCQMRQSSRPTPISKVELRQLFTPKVISLIYHKAMLIIYIG
uniref:Uncharacterized protein n=1 Tax=Lepeophtheirus salmonis TaxID=72036 RepID=A0A0K2T3I0_LEPSM